MNLDQRLQDLLQEADSCEPSAAPAGLAQQVRRLQISRRRRDRVLGGVAVSVAAIGIAWLVMGDGGSNTPTQITERTAPVTPDAPIAADNTFQLAAQDQAELDSQLRIAKRVSQILRRDLELPSLHRTSSPRKFWQDVKTEFEVVAQQMLCQADELRMAMQPDEPAIVAYQKVVELFPQTPAAEVARGRLAELQN